jgi:uncharacterized protein YndB with AHSA1/START domain
MPRVSRTRVIAAPRDRVWELVSDPHHLPRWWPRATRVEDVTGEAGSKRARWTVVLETEKGRGVRADYRCISAADRERYVWEQELAGTPFARIVRSSETGVHMKGDDGDTAVTVYTRERLRGMSRLGSPMMRGAVKQRLDDALDGIERALVAD